MFSMRNLTLWTFLILTEWCRFWTHRNLKSATHSMLSDILGGVSMPCLNHPLHMGTTAMASTWPSPDKDLNSQPAVPLVNGTNLARLRQIPIYFFSGSENAVFTPEATDMSYTTLRNESLEGQLWTRCFRWVWSSGLLDGREGGSCLFGRGWSSIW